MSIPDNLTSFLFSPSIQGGLLLVKIVFLFFSLFFLGGIIYFLLNSSWIRKIFLQDLIEILTYKPYWTRGIAKKWKKIKKRLETGLESEYKLAAIEADSMLNDALRIMGYHGESLGERLDKLTEAALPNIEQVRDVHKICNNVVHDPDYRLTLEQARRILAVYEHAFHDLQYFS